MGLAPPAKHEKVRVLACQTVRIGWKACSTGRTFQDSHSWAIGLPVKHEKFLMNFEL